MKERPILFSGPMVKALLAGTKTQTRRIVKPQPKHTDTWTTLTYFPKSGRAIERGPDYPDGEEDVRVCPYGSPGDRLWVRETMDLWPGTCAVYSCDGELVVNPFCEGHIERQEWLDNHAMAKVPSIFMPRWASRITLEITGVRVERVQSITEEDAEAEGATNTCDMPNCLHTYRGGFYSIWNSINGKKYPWASNPWVWILEFRRITP